MITAKELKNCRRGDFIKTINGYYKILSITKKRIYLSNCFRLDAAPKGKWLFRFSWGCAQINHPFWDIIHQGERAK